MGTSVFQVGSFGETVRSEMDGAPRPWGGEAVERQADRPGLGCGSSQGPLEILHQRNARSSISENCPTAACSVALAPRGAGGGRLEQNYQTGGCIRLKVEKTGPDVGMEGKGESEPCAEGKTAFW